MPSSNAIFYYFIPSYFKAKDEQKAPISTLIQAMLKRFLFYGIISLSLYSFPSSKCPKFHNFNSRAILGVCQPKVRSLKLSTVLKDFTTLLVHCRFDWSEWPEFVPVQLFWRWKMRWSFWVFQCLWRRFERSFRPKLWPDTGKNVIVGQVLRLRRNTFCQKYASLDNLYFAVLAETFWERVDCSWHNH